MYQLTSGAQTVLAEVVTSGQVVGKDPRDSDDPRRVAFALDFPPGLFKEPPVVSLTPVQEVANNFAQYTPHAVSVTAVGVHGFFMLGPSAFGLGQHGIKIHIIAVGSR
jgi:hypothetical protein